MSLLGYCLAQGSCSDRHGVRLSIASANQRLHQEMAQRLVRLFKLPVTSYEAGTGCTELKLVNPVAVRVWQHVLGLRETDPAARALPDLVFNVSEALRQAFLRGYFLGAGTIAASQLAFRTSSYDLASGLLYCLSSLDVIGSLTRFAPEGASGGEGAQAHWIVSVGARDDLNKLRHVWQDHPGAVRLRERRRQAERERRLALAAAGAHHRHHQRYQLAG